MLLGVVLYNHSPQADLIPIMDRLRLTGQNFLAVDKTAIDAVQVQQAELPPADDQLGVLSAYTMIMPAIRIQVDVREDIADWILTPEDGFLPTLR
jgi:hypothetical protein